MQWSQTENKRFIEIELREKGVYFEVGPIGPARWHQQTAGGMLSFKEFSEKPKWFEEFPRLWEQIKKDLQEIGKLDENI